MNLGRRLKFVPIALWVLSIASIFLAVKTSGDPVPTTFQNTSLAHLLQRFSTGNALVVGSQQTTLASSHDLAFKSSQLIDLTSRESPHSE
jgi:hypothetical protein